MGPKIILRAGDYCSSSRCRQSVVRTADVVVSSAGTFLVTVDPSRRVSGEYAFAST
jgi:hypothetical protein